LSPVWSRVALDEKAVDLVNLLFMVLKPRTVALFVSDRLGRIPRLLAIRSRSPHVVGIGHPLSGCDGFFRQALEGLGEIWIREVSARSDRFPSLYQQAEIVRSIRILPFHLAPDTQLLLVIDYEDPPDIDPIPSIEPLLSLFIETTPASEGWLERGESMLRFPIPIFLKRVLVPFIDYSLDIVSIRSIGLLLWGVLVPKGEILETFGETAAMPPEGRPSVFGLGPYSFRWAMGSSRRKTIQKAKDGRHVHYFPLRIDGDPIGNLCLEMGGKDEDTEAVGILIRILSWSIQRELKLIRQMGGEAEPYGTPRWNPYDAIIRVIEEWSNASRYNEYLSLGFIHLKIDGLDVSRGKKREQELFNMLLSGRVEEAMRKGDVIFHCSRGDLALIFPRTPPEGAETALRRLRNVLEGRKLMFDGTTVRVRSAHYSVLSYPIDLPTKETVLEKCSYLFLPK